MERISDRVLARCAELGIYADDLAYQLDLRPEMLQMLLEAPEAAPEGFWERAAAAVGLAGEVIIVPPGRER